MNNSTITYIFLGIILSIITYNIYFDASSNVTPINPPKPSTTVQCGPFDNNTIKKCDEKQEICKNCRCLGSDPSVEIGCMSCQVVDDDSPYKVNLTINDCVGNFIWDDQTQSCSIKNGSYCLPVIPSDIQCNKYTGTKILTRKSDGTYKWDCICKNDTYFTNSGTDGGNCSTIRLCGIESGQNPNPNNKRGLINKNDGSFWNSLTSDWDPFPGSGNSACSCGSQDEFSNGLTCMPNGCSPGKQIDSTKCDCSMKGYINCSDIAYRVDPISGNYYTGVCKLPSCIPNPCLGGRDATTSQNHYDISSNSCVCGDDGFIPYIDASNSFVQTCKKICDPNDPSIGPCGNRGTCYVWDQNLDNNIWTIECERDNSGEQCLNPPSQFIYLNNIQGSGLSGDFSLLGPGKSEKFTFEPSCYQDKNGCNVSAVSQIFNNDKYYIKNNQGKYMDFKNQVLVDSHSDDITIIATRDSDCKDATQFKLYLPVSNLYISGTLNSSNKVQSLPSFKNTARCKNCTQGYTQGPQQRCEHTCAASEVDCISDNDCCSGKCKFYDWPGYFGCE